MKAFVGCAAMIVGLAALAGCGVKNLPVAPGTDAAPSVATGQPVDQTVIGTGGSATAVRAPRIAGETSESLTGAEVTRIPSAKRKSFPLDPLLN